MPEPKPARAATPATVNISSSYQPTPDPVQVDSFGQLEFSAQIACYVFFADPSMFGVTNPQHEGLGPNQPLTARVANATTGYNVQDSSTPPPTTSPYKIKIGAGVP